MYSKKDKRKKNIIALTAIMCAFILFGSLVSATTSNNVIVASVNYVDQKFNQLAQRISQLEAKAGSTTGSTKPTYPTSGDSVTISDKELAELKEDMDLINKQLKNYYGPKVRYLSEASKYKVVVLEKGQKIIAQDVVELIVRGGLATAIEGKNGDGIADMTSGDGMDYYTGDKLPKNHYLLISRGDGRGVKAESETVYIMVKGQYGIRLPE